MSQLKIGNSLFEPLNKAILQMLQSGQLEALKSRYLQAGPSKLRPFEQSIKKTIMLFINLAFSAALSAFTLAFEISCPALFGTKGKNQFPRQEKVKTTELANVIYLL